MSSLATGGYPKKIGGYELGQVPRFGPEQMELYRSLLGASQGPSQQALGTLSQVASGDPSQFAAMEAPAFRQYGQLLGQLGSRFSGQGMGGRFSSAFGNVSAGAARELAENLQSRRMDLQQQAIRDLLGMSQSLLSASPYENILIEPKQKKAWWQALLGGGLPVIGAGLGGFFGGPAGASLGGTLGSRAAQAFL